jgi:hypothetical protein
MTKKINVNSSSLICLKAELLKKQAEVNEVKLKNQSISGLPQITKKRKRKNVKNMENTKELIDSDDIVAHKKSKLMLEAKTRLYEKLKKSKNNNDNFLVDFKNKLDEESDEECVDETINEEHPIEPDENWVEYQDCFGRTRKCLREDLSYMQMENELIKQKVMKETADRDREEENKEQFSTQKKEPEIEIMRRKWEQQTQKLVDKMDIHYQDILFDEARAHGVGYYAFSQDEDERVKQQESLANLRKETKMKQMETKEINELKERVEQNRLNKARIRQRIRAGLPAEPTKEELAQKNKIYFIDNNYAEKNNYESTKSDTEKSNDKITHKLATESTEKANSSKEENNDDEDKIKLFGELLNKKNWYIMSQEEWIQKCRTQRISKFGPTYNNCMNAESYNNSPCIEKSVYKDNRNNNLEIYNSETHDNSANKITSNEKYNQNDKNNFTGCDTILTNNKTEKELSRNLIESTLNSTRNLSNSQLSQVQPIVSYPLSHLSSNYLQNTYNNSGTCAYEQRKETNDLNISIPDKNNTTLTSSDKFTHVIKPTTFKSQNINEDSIMAGLKYLREKFEETHK